MKKMNLSAAIKRAASASKKYGGDDKGKKKKEKMKEQEIGEVQASGNVFTGPFSKMKAKRAIKKGDVDVAYAKKKGLKQREKTIKYEDFGTLYNKPGDKTGTNVNRPIFMNKKVTSRMDRFGGVLKRYDLGKKD